MRFVLVLIALLSLSAHSFGQPSLVSNYFSASTGLLVSESDANLSLILNWTGNYKKLQFRVSPIDLGFSSEKNDNTRFRSETFSNGNTVCRDLSTGRFANKSNCMSDVKILYAFSTDASYNFGDQTNPVYIGIGSRFSDNSTLYLSGAAFFDTSYKKVSWYIKTNIGSKLFVLNAGMSFSID